MRDVNEHKSFSELDDETLSTVSQIFKALGDPTRLRILRLLSFHPCSVNEIAETLNLGQSTVSHQLRLLKQLRLVTYRREGTTFFYAPDDKHVMDMLNQTLKHANHN